MKLNEAFDIVLELAEQNILDDERVENDSYLKKEQSRQKQAVKRIRSYYSTSSDNKTGGAT
jgi:hypothetical protein